MTTQRKIGVDNGYIKRVVDDLSFRYGKDEYVAWLKNEIKSRDITIGKLKSEVQYLEHEVADAKENKLARREAKKLLLTDELYLNQKEQNKKLAKKVKELTILRDSLIAKLNTKKQ